MTTIPTIFTAYCNTGDAIINIDKECVFRKEYLTPNPYTKFAYNLRPSVGWISRTENRADLLENMQKYFGNDFIIVEGKKRNDFPPRVKKKQQTSTATIDEKKQDNGEKAANAPTDNIWENQNTDFLIDSFRIIIENTPNFPWIFVSTWAKKLYEQSFRRQVCGIDCGEQGILVLRNCFGHFPFVEHPQYCTIFFDKYTSEHENFLKKYCGVHCDHDNENYKQHDEINFLKSDAHIISKIDKYVHKLFGQDDFEFIEFNSSAVNNQFEFEVVNKMKVKDVPHKSSTNKGTKRRRNENTFAKKFIDVKNDMKTKFNAFEPLQIYTRPNQFLFVENGTIKYEWNFYNGTSNVLSYACAQ